MKNYKSCKQLKLFSIIIFLIYLIFSLGLDYFSQEPTYGVTLFNALELLIFIAIIIYIFCKYKIAIKKTKDNVRAKEKK